MDCAWIWMVSCMFQMLQEIIETQDLIMATCFRHVLMC